MYFTSINCYMFNLYGKMFPFLLKTSLFVGDVNLFLMGSTKSMKIESPQNIMISQYTVTGRIIRVTHKMTLVSVDNLLIRVIQESRYV